jgi:hypothetical protein
VCLSNLFEWGVIWKAYTEDHDGYFPPRGGGDVWGEETMAAWPYVIRQYLPSLDSRIYLCPSATKPLMEGGRCPYAAWNVGDGGDIVVYGSYCANFWLSNDSYSKFWRTLYTGAAVKIPVLLDGTWKDTEPEPYDAPPSSREWIQTNCWEPNRNEMKRVCHYRHESIVNGVFLDLSARKIGLKELWQLKWHREWPEDNPPPAWPEWMQNFKDY